MELFLEYILRDYSKDPFFCDVLSYVVIVNNIASPTHTRSFSYQTVSNCKKSNCAYIHIGNRLIHIDSFWFSFRSCIVKCWTSHIPCSILLCKTDCVLCTQQQSNSGPIKLDRDWNISNCDSVMFNVSGL